MIDCGSIIANRYSLVRLIGKGGMGSVYEAKGMDRTLSRRSEIIVTFGRRCIPARCVARRLHTPSSMRPPRALRVGRIGVLDVTHLFLSGS